MVDENIGIIRSIQSTPELITYAKIFSIIDFKIEYFKEMMNNPKLTNQGVIQLTDLLIPHGYTEHFDDVVINLFLRRKLMCYGRYDICPNVTLSQYNFDILFDWMIHHYKTHQCFYDDNDATHFIAFVKKFISIGCILHEDQIMILVSIPSCHNIFLEKDGIIYGETICQKGLCIHNFFLGGDEKFIYTHIKIQKKIKLTNTVWSNLICMTNDFDCNKYTNDLVTFFKKSIRRTNKTVIDWILKSTNKFLQSVVLELYYNVSQPKQMKLIIKNMNASFLERMLDKYDLCNNYIIDYILLIDQKVHCHIIEHILTRMREKKRSLFEFTRKKVINYMLQSDDIHFFKYPLALTNILNIGLTDILDIYTLKLSLRLDSTELINECINHKIFPNDDCIKYLLMNVSRSCLFKTFKQNIRFFFMTQQIFVKIINSRILYSHDHCNSYDYESEFREQHEFVIKCIETGCILTEDLISNLFIHCQNLSYLKSTGNMMKCVDEILKKNGCNIKTMLLGLIKSCSYDIHGTFMIFLEQFIKTYSPKIDYDIMTNIAIKTANSLIKLVATKFIDQNKNDQITLENIQNNLSETQI